MADPNGLVAPGYSWKPERMFGCGSDVREAVNPIHLYRTENQTMGQHIRLDASVNGNMPTRPVGLFQDPAVHSAFHIAAPAV